jgi:flagellar basal body L-ring protein FlgH
MRHGIRFLFCLLVMITFTRCSDMINSLQRENDAIDASSADRDRDSNDVADDDAPKKVSLDGPSANNTDAYAPPVRRNYSRHIASLSNVGDDSVAQGDGSSPEHRARRDDFIDKNSSENSLWDSQGQSNYLFTNNRRHEQGDLLTVDVERELRREIQYQLWQTLPPEERHHRPSAAPTDSVSNVASAPAGANGAADSGKSTIEKNKDAAAEDAKNNLMQNGKDDDVIRMEVSENVGNGLVRLTGQKRVIYHGVARVIEVTALINNKDIDDQNHLKSSAFLDMQSRVVQ